MFDHLPLGLLAMAPLPLSPSSPLGRYGAVVAASVSIAVVIAALAVHLAAVFGQGSGTDPFIDSAALLVIGVVLGASALGGQVGQVQQAHDSATAANKRLDALGAPPAADGTAPDA